MKPPMLATTCPCLDRLRPLGYANICPTAKAWSPIRHILPTLVVGPPKSLIERGTMGSFGNALRRLRSERGWRQQDLADALDGRLGRSTIANLETDRERPTPRVMSLLSEVAPEWTSALQPHYETSRSRPRPGRVRPQADEAPDASDRPRHLLAGPFVIEQLQLIYVFRHSRSPEEIIEVRSVRATTSGADGYGLKLEQTRADGFRVEEEPLWGGHLVDSEHLDRTGHTVYLRRMDFERTLRKGQVHDFAVRSWIERDPEPDTVVQARFSIPCKELAIHLNFRGPDLPRQAWAFGPIPDDALVPQRAADGEPLEITIGGTVSKYYSPVDAANEYGIAWAWD